MKVFVPPAPTPFTDPNGKKKYTEVELGEHIMSTLRSLAGSTIFGIVLQTFLHFYKDMVTGLCIQSVMAPINFIDNAVVKYFLLGDKNAFEYKKKEDLTDEDEVVDAEGNTVVIRPEIATTKKKKKEPETNVEEIMLDTWDRGAEADIAPLLKVLTKKNVNNKSKESGWTPVMIMAGLGVRNTTEGLNKLKSLGANPSTVDEEGWNSLHWSAFHGSAGAASHLLSPEGFDGVSIGLHLVKDKEGKTALDHAETEKNDDVAAVIRSSLSKEEVSTTETPSEGLRKRK